VSFTAGRYAHPIPSDRKALHGSCGRLHVKHKTWNRMECGMEHGMEHGTDVSVIISPRWALIRVGINWGKCEQAPHSCGGLHSHYTANPKLLFQQIIWFLQLQDYPSHAITPRVYAHAAGVKQCLRVCVCVCVSTKNIKKCFKQGCKGVYRRHSQRKTISIIILGCFYTRYKSRRFFTLLFQLLPIISFVAVSKLHVVVKQCNLCCHRCAGGEPGNEARDKYDIYIHSTFHFTFHSTFHVFTGNPCGRGIHEGIWTLQPVLRV